MNKVFKKSGRKFVKKISLFSKRVNRDGREHIRENLIGHISHIRDVRLYVVEWILMVVIITLLSITQAYWYVNSFAVETYTNGGTYTEATLGKINSFNPLFASTSSEETLSRLLFARRVGSCERVPSHRAHCCGVALWRRHVLRVCQS